MLSAPRAAGLQFQVENHVVFFRELENFLERRYTLPGELAAEPRAGIQATQVRQGKVVHGPLAIGGAVDGGVVNGDKTGVAGELQIGFDERSALRDSLAKGCQCIFRRVAGSSAMGNHQHSGTCAFDRTIETDTPVEYASTCCKLALCSPFPRS